MRFRVILKHQWRWTRIVIVFGTVVAFALPILSVQGATRGPGAVRPIELLLFLQGWSALYPLAACALGLIVAMAIWAPDHRGRHVHALSLPVPRWQLVLLRFSAGIVLLLLPIIALQIGAILAAKGAAVPAGLRTYPFSLGFRFGLATLTAFAIFFAISGGTSRTAGVLLGTFGGLILLATVASSLGLSIDTGELLEYGLNLPGPLALFIGRWMLIDV
jgi:hypothetical protein